MLRTADINSKADIGIAWTDPPDNYIYIYLQVSTNIAIKLAILWDTTWGLGSGGLEKNCWLSLFVSTSLPTIAYFVKPSLFQSSQIQ